MLTREELNRLELTMRQMSPVDLMAMGMRALEMAVPHYRPTTETGSEIYKLTNDFVAQMNGLIAKDR